MASGSSRQHLDYEYTKLKDVRVGSKFNLFGIVKRIIKTNAQTRTGKLHSIFLITDETLQPSVTFRMHVFSSINIQTVAEGMILRFHRVKVEDFDGTLDGRVFQGHDVVMFPSTDGDEPYSLAHSPTLTDEDKLRVSELREFAAINAIFSEYDNPFDHRTSSNTEKMGKNTSPHATEDKRIVIGKPTKQPHQEHHTKRNSSRSPKNSNSSKTDDSRIVIGKPTKQPHQEEHHTKKKSSKSPEPSQEKDSISTRKAYQHKRHVVGEGEEDSCKSDSECDDRNGVEYDENKKVVLLPNPFNPRFQFRGENTQQLIDSLITSSLPECNNQTDKNSAALKRKSPDKEENQSINKQMLDDTTVEPFVEALQPSCSKPSDKVTRKTARVQPMTCSPTSKKNQVQENVSSAESLDASKGDRSFDSMNPINNNDVTPAEDACPGMACAIDCAQRGPVILDDDDQRIQETRKLVFEGDGDIPACDEEGNSISRPNLVTSSALTDEQKTIITNVRELQSYEWPRYRAKVRIVAIKPGLEALKTSGRRNLLSGFCSHCKTHVFYSNLVWETNQVNRRKKPLCPTSRENGRKDYVSLEFRLKVTVKDAWGTELCIYGTKADAAQFLGCTPKEYQEDVACRQKVTALFSEALSSQSFFFINFYKVNTLLKHKYFICNTELSHALNN